MSNELFDQSILMFWKNDNSLLMADLTNEEGLDL